MLWDQVSSDCNTKLKLTLYEYNSTALCHHDQIITTSILYNKYYSCMCIGNPIMDNDLHHHQSDWSVNVDMVASDTLQGHFVLEHDYSRGEQLITKGSQRANEKQRVQKYIIILKNQYNINHTAYTMQQ